MKKVAIIMGSDSDLPVVTPAVKQLKELGIPCSAKVLDGMDAMLATIMMPPGIPVAAVGVNAAKNAALLAAEILAVGDDELMKKLQNMRSEMAAAVIEKDRAIQEKLKEI